MLVILILFDGKFQVFTSIFITQLYSQNKNVQDHFLEHTWLRPNVTEGSELVLVKSGSL